MQYLHNPRCSKSRQGLELLKKQGVEPEIRLYLKDPLTAPELETLLSALKINDPKLMMRTKEPEFKQLALADATHQRLIEAMVTHPKLIERPILINENQACIGRPPEDLLGIV